MSQNRCAMDDFGVFLALWNESQNHPTPTIHFQIARWLQKCVTHGHKRLLLQAFRASGKSTIAGIFCAWNLYRDPDMRILVLSAESKLAQKMVRTIRKIIERHPLTKSLRPDAPDQWASDSFTIKRKTISRDPSVLARGLYANVTGTRADMIVCDDVEVPNTCDTPLKREALRERLMENEFILTPQGAILYLGTPHSYFTIYAKRARAEIGEKSAYLKGYKRLTIPILDKNGQSAWPERYSTARIEELRAASGLRQFSSQMMLTPLNINEGRLDAHLLQRYDAPLVVQESQGHLRLTLKDTLLVSGCAWWDPAFGRGAGDKSVLAVVFTDEDGNRWLHHLRYISVDGQGEDDEATQQCKIVTHILREYCIPRLYIETNGIGKFLPAMARKIIAQEGLSTAVLDHHARENKQKRILESFDCALAARSLFVHGSVYDTPFVHELSEWHPSAKGAQDDGLDAVAGALMAQPMRLKPIYRAHGKTMRWGVGAKPHAAKTDFPV